MSESSWRPLLEPMLARLSADVASWLVASIDASVAGGAAADAFVRGFSGAGRRLGRLPLSLSVQEASDLRGRGALVPRGWAVDEAGRVLLLLAAMEGTAVDRQVAFVDDLFRTGDVRERQAIARALPHLPGAERFAPLAADVVRSNMTTVIEAIGCDNPFPCAHMPDASFNQLVMKMLFGELPLGRLVGLEERLNADLVRMTTDWVSERRAAGRVVPDDTNFILTR